MYNAKLKLAGGKEKLICYCCHLRRNMNVYWDCIQDFWGFQQWQGSEVRRGQKKLPYKTPTEQKDSALSLIESVVKMDGGVS